MNKIDFINLGGFPMELNDLDKFQSNLLLLQQITSAIAGTDPVILSGCVDTAGVVSAGYMIINGEILPFAGGALATYVDVSEVTTNKTFEDGASKIVFRTRAAVFSIAGTPWADFVRVPILSKIFSLLGGTAGQILKKASNDDYDFEWVDEEDITGKLDKSTVEGGTTAQILKKNSNTDFDFVWEDETAVPAFNIVTTATDNGQSLTFDVSAGSPYTIDNIVYRFDYILTRKFCSLSFSVDFDVTDGADISEFRIPLPDGIVKDTSYRFFGSAVYYSPTGTTGRCPLEVRSYKDGSEGQRLVLRRADIIGSVASDTGIHVTIEGSIQFVTT